MKTILVALVAALAIVTPSQAAEQPTVTRSSQWCEHVAKRAYHGEMRNLHCYPLNPSRDWWNCLRGERRWFYVTCS